MIKRFLRLRFCSLLSLSARFRSIILGRCRIFIVIRSYCLFPLEEFSMAAIQYAELWKSSLVCDFFFLLIFFFFFLFVTLPRIDYSVAIQSNSRCRCAVPGGAHTHTYTHTHTAVKRRAEQALWRPRFHFHYEAKGALRLRSFTLVPS